MTDGRSAAGVADGTLVAGGVLAAAGTVLLVLSAVSGGETRATDGAPPQAGSPPRAARLDVLPVVGPGLVLLSAGGVF